MALVACIYRSILGMGSTTSRCDDIRTLHHHMTDHLTGQIEEGRVVLERGKSERQIGLCHVRVLECVPESVAGAEQSTADVLPVTLGVFDRSDSSARLRADYMTLISACNTYCCMLYLQRGHPVSVIHTSLPPDTLSVDPTPE
jgi:hypothetical protein